MILKVFVEKLAAQLPDCSWHVVPGEQPKIVFPAVSQEFGDIDVTEEDGELTVTFGRFTHAHFACYDADLSEAAQADQISSNAISSLADTFADRLEFYGNHSGRGGFRQRTTEGTPSKLLAGKDMHVWSGSDG